MLSSAGPPPATGGQATATRPLKNRGSLKSLFTSLRASKSEQQSYPSKQSFFARVSASFSTTSLSSHTPQKSTGRLAERSESPESSTENVEHPTASTVSLPAQIQPTSSGSPSSSSSSTSSFDFASDSSTTLTTPTSSSPSLLMKATSGVPVVTSPRVEKSEDSAVGSPLASVKSPDHLRKPYYRPMPYILPTAPESSVLHERRNSFQPKRRNSLSRMLARRTQSFPDLTKTLDAYSPSSPPASAHSSRPPSSVSNLANVPPPQKKPAKGRRRLADLEKPTSYSEKEKMEHRSILGADPAGLGFYLYPTSGQELVNRRHTMIGAQSMRYPGPRPTPEGNRNSWAGMSADVSGDLVGNGRRREPRGRGFCRNVTSQIIVEEDGNDICEVKADTTAISDHHNSTLRSNQLQKELAPPGEGAVEAVLGCLQHEADNHLNTSHRNQDHDKVDETPDWSGSVAGKLGTIPRVPAAKVEMVEA
jgi:hypothetical protein